MAFAKLFRSSYFVAPRDFIGFFQRWLLLSGIIALVVVCVLDLRHMEHNKWHRILGYTHAIQIVSSSPGRFIFVPMWTYGCHFLIAGVRLSLQRSTIEGRLSACLMNLKYVVCGLWVSIVCVFPLVAAFDEPKVCFTIVLYSVLALSFHLYGLFEHLEYRQKGAHGYALWTASRLVLNSTMLGMMMYDYLVFIRYDGDGHFEPPVPPLLLQIIEYTTYLSIPVTEYFVPATDSMEVRTTVTSGTITKEVGAVPTIDWFAPAVATHTLGSHWGLVRERKSESKDDTSQALVQAIGEQPSASQSLSSTQTPTLTERVTPKLSMARAASTRPKALFRKAFSIRTPGQVYDAIVFEGGGTKGTAYAGAVRKLEEENLMKSITKFGGTSAGAQTAVLVAVGYTGDQLADVARTTPWEQVFDFDQGFAWTLRAAWNIRTRLGACRGEFLLKYLEALIKKKMGQDWITFQQFYDKTGIELQLGVSNVTLGCFQFLSKDTHGEMPLALGAMASSSIPFLFPPVRWGGHMYTDGGVGGNLPTKAFRGTRMLACKLQTAYDDEPVDPETLGGYLAAISDLIFSCAQSVGGHAADKITKAREKAMRCEYARGIGVDIVHVNCGDCGVVETEMPLERINNVIALGYESMSVFLKGNQDDAGEDSEGEDSSALDA